MSYQPPRKPSQGGSRLPMTKKTSIVRESPTETTLTSVTTTSIPKSTPSSGRPSSCGSAAPCGTGRPARTGIPSTGLRAPAARGGIARPTVVETTSSFTVQDSVAGTVTTKTEKRTIPGPARSTGYGLPTRMATPASAVGPGAGRSGMPAPIYQKRQIPTTSGYAPRRASIPGPTRPISAPTPAPRSVMETISTSSMTEESDGRQTITSKTETVERIAPPERPAARRLPTATRPRTLGYGPPQPPVRPAAVTDTSSATSLGAIPKTRKITSKTSKTDKKGSKTITTTQEVTKLLPAQPPLPEGRYAMSLKFAPHTKQGRLMQFDSPGGLRGRMDADAPRGLKMIPPEFKGIQDIRQLTSRAPYKDLISCAMDITHGRAPASPGRYRDTMDTSFLEQNIEPEYGSPYQRPTKTGSLSPLGPPTAPTTLEKEVEERLYQAAAQSPGKPVRVSGTRKSPGKLPIIMTDQGPVSATEQVITEKKVERAPGAEKISRHIIGVEKKGCGAIQTELHTQTLEPGGLPQKGDTIQETVSVTSSVAIAAGGLKEATTTVVYETTKPPEKPKQGGISPADVERLIEEETRDVEKTKDLKPVDLKVLSPKSYTVKKREHGLKLNYTSVVQLEQSYSLPEPTADQELEEIQPEVVANILHTEEMGVQLAAQPVTVYDALFPVDKDADMITVNSAAPAPLQDVLVPAQLPANLHEQGVTPELESTITLTEEVGGVKPPGNGYSELVAGGKPPRVNNVAKRGKRKKVTKVPLLSQEIPPWGVEDLQPILDIVGAPLNSSLIVESIEEPQEKDDSQQQQQQDETIGIDYMLQLEPPTHASRVQLRGSTKPPWFPGYFVALPEIPELIKVVKTPNHVLASAWKSVQPNYFPDDTIITI